MTILTLQDDIKLHKTIEFGEFSKDNLDDYLLFEIEKAKKLPDFYFVNLK